MDLRAGTQERMKSMGNMKDSIVMDGSFKIVVDDLGKGIVAGRFFERGSVVFQLDGYWVDAPTMYTIQLGHDKHLQPSDHLWALVNHSCTPNLRIDLNQHKMIAVNDIAEGEHLSFNYLSTEWDMAAPFQCGCRSFNCIGTIKGARYLNVSMRRQLFLWAPDN